LRGKQRCQLLIPIKLFLKYNALLVFCSDNVMTFSEASCHAFQYEKFVIKIHLQWKRTCITWCDIKIGLNLM